MRWLGLVLLLGPASCGGGASRSSARDAATDAAADSGFSCPAAPDAGEPSGADGVVFEVINELPSAVCLPRWNEFILSRVAPDESLARVETSACAAPCGDDCIEDCDFFPEGRELPSCASREFPWDGLVVEVEWDGNCGCIAGTPVAPEGEYEVAIPYAEECADPYQFFGTFESVAPYRATTRFNYPATRHVELRITGFAPEP